MRNIPSRRTAVVLCAGGAGRPPQAAGLDCRQALERLSPSQRPCAQGCLGLGSCAALCPKGAISFGPLGAAQVDRALCVGCGLCLRACPQGLIQLLPAEEAIAPRCSNRDGGAAARQICPVSCVACRICETNCPVGAVSIADQHAVIRRDRCISCGMCAVKCPRGVMVDGDGIFTRREGGKRP